MGPTRTRRAAAKAAFATAGALALLLGSLSPAQAGDADEAAMAAALEALDAALPGDLLHNPMEAQWNPRGDVRTGLVDAPMLATGQAIEAKVRKRNKNPWDTVLTMDIPQAVQKGERVQVYYYARTAKPPKGSEAATVGLFLGRNSEPYDALVAQDVTPGSDWKMLSLTGEAQKDFPAGSLKLEYQLGTGKQVVEFGPAYVSVLGR